MREEVKKARFIEWLCTPRRDRDPSTQEELARRMRVSANTLSKWKQDKAFLEAWELHYLQSVGSPERKQTLMDTLFKTGSDADDPRHVQAAAKYMELADGLRPQQIEVTVRPARELTDDQIEEIVVKHAAKEAEERKLRLVEGG